MTAITCIQIGYTNNLYNNYKKKEIIMINNHLLIAIDEELHLRKLVPKSTDKRLITYKRLEDMTPQESQIRQKRHFRRVRQQKSRFFPRSPGLSSGVANRAAP